MSVAQQLQDMIDSDDQFRAQFDPASEHWHGDANLEPVNADPVKKIPKGMEAHKNWQAFKEQEAPDFSVACNLPSAAAAETFGAKFEALTTLRAQMTTLKKAVQSMCAPVDKVVTAKEKLAKLDAECAAAAAKAAAPEPEASGAAAAALPADAPEFVACAAFDGARPGYAFKTEEQGVGYYLLKGPTEAEKKAARAAEARREKADARKRARLQKVVDKECKTRDETFAKLRETAACVRDTKYHSLEGKIGALMADGLKEMTVKQFREGLSVRVKRTTEICFRYSDNILVDLKKIKAEAGVRPEDKAVADEGIDAEAAAAAYAKAAMRPLWVIEAEGAPEPEPEMGSIAEEAVAVKTAAPSRADADVAEAKLTAALAAAGSEGERFLLQTKEVAEMNQYWRALAPPSPVTSPPRDFMTLGAS